MKKPKKKSKPIPKDSLIIDYGQYRIVMPYRVSMEKYNNRDIAIMFRWCEETFKADSFRRTNGWPGYIYFVDESAATMLKLRWM